MRSDFLRDLKTLNKLSRNGTSQSLLNEVWFPSRKKWKIHSSKDWVAIPSKWGLISFAMSFVKDLIGIKESQSLLNEVWFPSKGMAFCDVYYGESQSLLNEVWFPSSLEISRCTLRGWSQSLLNEVWFPSAYRAYRCSVWGWLSQSLLNEVWFPSTETFRSGAMGRMCRNPF